MNSNPTARDLLTLLPLALLARDFMHFEKLAVLPRKLTTTGAPASPTPVAGDLGYFDPWGNLAFFHADWQPSPGLVVIGRFEGSLDALRVKGEMPVRVAIEQDKVIAQLRRQVSKGSAASQSAESAGEATSRMRFSAKGLASNRARLGISAEDFGRLVGVTGQSIYAWESGRSVPRAKQLAAIASLRGVGKKEVRARLETATPAQLSEG